MVNSSRVAWSDVWLWPIRLAQGRFMSETAVSLSLPLLYMHIHTHCFATPPPTACCFICLGSLLSRFVFYCLLHFT